MHACVELHTSPPSSIPMESPAVQMCVTSTPAVQITVPGDLNSALINLLN